MAEIEGQAPHPEPIQPSHEVGVPSVSESSERAREYRGDPFKDLMNAEIKLAQAGISSDKMTKFIAANEALRAKGEPHAEFHSFDDMADIIVQDMEASRQIEDKLKELVDSNTGSNEWAQQLAAAIQGLDPEKVKEEILRPYREK